MISVIELNLKWQQIEVINLFHQYIKAHMIKLRDILNGMRDYNMTLYTKK